jgi:hypothetical protein
VRQLALNFIECRAPRCSDDLIWVGRLSVLSHQLWWPW